MKRDAVIVSAVRTAIGRQGGALASVPAHIFGAEVIKEAINRANVQPEMIEDVIMGNVISGGGNIARLDDRPPMRIGNQRSESRSSGHYVR